MQHVQILREATCALAKLAIMATGKLVGRVTATIDRAHLMKSVLRQQVMNVSAKKDSASRRTWIYAETSTNAWLAMIATATQFVITQRAALAVIVNLATSAMA